MKRPDEVTEYLRCGGMNCDNTCSTQLDRLGVEDCQTWRVHGYVQQLEERVVHLEALNQQNLSVITMQERTRARLEEQISQFESHMPRWISVEERLPKELQYVLAINQYDDDSFEPCIAYFRAGQWFHGSYMGGDITYWMSLPQPPKEE